ncbi:MAG: putative clumping factor A-like [Gammaproteobacteria bacterium]|nr:MAG: putative clumping factor A-like [Gammaproteobacteria bacterium]TND04062.1 MAG: putative clumping factor A-like [Gammaproteobacteria bacterium]
MKISRAACLLAASLVLVAPVANAVDRDDLDVTMEVMDHDMSADDFMNTIELPEAASDRARDSSQSGLSTANEAHDREHGGDRAHDGDRDRIDSRDDHASGDVRDGAEDRSDDIRNESGDRSGDMRDDSADHADGIRDDSATRADETRNDLKDSSADAHADD